MGWLTGFEPAHDGFTIHCLNRLTTATTAVTGGLTSWAPIVKNSLLAGLSEFRHELQTNFLGHGLFLRCLLRHPGMSCPRRAGPEGLNHGCFLEFNFFSGTVNRFGSIPPSIALWRGNCFTRSSQPERILEFGSRRQTRTQPDSGTSGRFPRGQPQIRF